MELYKTLQNYFRYFSILILDISVSFSQGPPRNRDDALVVRPQFAVGDRVEYRSDTHRQWLPGTVSDTQVAMHV